MLKKLPLVASLGALLFFVPSAYAQSNEPPAADTTKATVSPRDPRIDVPLVNYAISAFGAEAGKVGASGGVGALGRTVSPENTGAATQVIGTFRAWASPINRVTFFSRWTLGEHLQRPRRRARRCSFASLVAGSRDGRSPAR